MNFSSTQKKLILEVLSNGDGKVLKLIDSELKAFTGMIDAYGQAAGTKWDDLVIKFEWKFKVNEIQANKDYAD